MYNGNISETTWKTANDNIKRGYGYQYDALNRITQGISNDGKYNLSGITYDKVGNTLTLNRKGHLDAAASSFGDMDKLIYTYDTGNKLLQVTDTGNTSFGFKDSANTNDDFAYDANGNMILDQNKGITGITYNHLNLPKTVTIHNADHTGNITYIYDATGAKLKKIATEGSSLTTEYAGNYVYKNGTLEFFNHPEGYVEKEADGYKYVYQYKDHLGNIRLSYKDADKNGSISQSEIVEEKNYYPFGMTHSGYNFAVNGSKHNYGFNGKEYSEELDLNTYDFGARNYDPSLGRWMNIDPLADKYYPISPYTYVANNPIMFIDPDGKRIILPKNKQQRRSVRRVLRKLRRSSKTARTHIRRLKRDKNHDVTIKVSSNPRGGSRFISKNAKASSTKGKGSGGTLIWNSNDTNFKSDKNVDGTNTASSSRNFLEEVVHASRSVAGEQAEGDSKANLGNEWKSSFNNANEEVETNEIVNESLVEMGQDGKQRTTYTMTFLKKDENGSIVDKKKVSLPIPVTEKKEEKEKK